MHADDKKPSITSPLQDTTQAAQQYSLNHTVNFNNVSVIEVIRFVSKITGYNFIFGTEDLGFNVTIFSEEPMSTQNIMTALIQILRIHGLKMLEQEENFVITKIGSGANQIPDIVSADIPGSDKTKSPIITRVFRVKNTPPSTLADVLQPMLSSSSLIEIVPQTNQLIVTDVATNIAKVADLLSSIDLPLSNLTIESYTIQHMGADQIIPLTQKILAPFLGGNPLILVPQKETNTIFIISTPHLVEQTMGVLEDLDIEGKVSVVGHGALETFVYKIQHQRPDVLLQDLQTISSQTQNADPNLVQAIQGANYIASAGTIVFLTDTSTWEKLKNLLAGIDTTAAPVSKPTFWMYKVEKADPDTIKAALKQLSNSVQDPSLQETIASAQWIAQSHSLVFTGSESAIARLQEVVPTLDVKEAEPGLFIYKIEHSSEPQIEASLEKITDTMQNSNFTAAIQGMQWVKASNSLIFKTDPSTVDQLKQILPTLDVATGELSLYVYKIQNTTTDQMQASLDQVADGSQDAGLIAAIHGMQIVPETKTLIFNAPSDAVAKLQKLIPTLDVAKEKTSEMYLYKVQGSSLDELQSALEDLLSSISDADLKSTIESLKQIPDKHTIMFLGSKDSIEKLEKILPTLDTASYSKQLFLYKIQKGSYNQIINSLKKMAKASKDKGLMSAVDSSEWIEDSDTIVFHTTPDEISKLQSMLPSLDVAKLVAPHKQLFVYKTQAAIEEKIQAALQRVAAASKDPELIETIRTMQWVPESQTFVFQGSEGSIAEVKDLLKTIDIKDSKTEPYIYQVQKGSEEHIVSLLKQLADSSEDKDLVHAIKTLQWVKDSHTLIFNASPETVTRLQTLLPQLDSGNSSLQTYLYPLRQTSQEKMQESLQQLANSSKDVALVQAINSVSWVEESHTFIFQGTPKAIAELEKILPTFDVSKSALTRLYLYKVNPSEVDQLRAALEQIAISSDDVGFKEAVKTMQWSKPSSSLIFQGNDATLTELKSVLQSIDISSSHQEIYVYKVQNTSEQEIANALHQLSDSLQDKDLTAAIEDMRIVPDSRSLLFKANSSTIAKLKTLIPTLDVKTPPSTEMLMYKPKVASHDQMASALDQIANTTQNKAIVSAIENSKWIEESGTFIFYINQESSAELQQILSTVDATRTAAPRIYIYKLQNISPDKMQELLEDLASKSQDKDFVTAIDSIQWVPENRTFIFHTTKLVADQLQSLLTELDVKGTAQQIYIYKTQNPSPAHLAASLHQMESTTQDKALAEAIHSMHWVADSNSFIFQGSAEAIAKLQALLPSLDNETPPVAPQLYMYTLQKASQGQLLNTLDQMAQKSGDKDLIAAVDDVQWIPSSKTLVFHTTPAVIAKLQAILPTLDVATGPVLQMYMYKVQTAPKDQIMSALDLMADTTQDKDLASAIESVKWIDESHAFIFNGTAAAISQLQTILPSLDTVSTPALSAISSKGQFFIYNPKHRSGEELSAAIQELSDNLQGSGLQNSNFLTALESMKWVSSSHSLIFTGDTASLDKIQSILAVLDVPAPGAAKTFLYKPVYASETQLQNALMQFAQRLDPNNAADHKLAQAIYTMKWIDDSHSFSFSADSDTLVRLQATLSSLDSPQGLSTLSSGNFFLYKLQHIQGNTILTNLSNVAAKFPASDPNAAALTKAIQNIKWVEDNNSLMITGSPYIIDQVKNLIAEFDTASAAPKTVQSDLFMYKPLNKTPDQLVQAISDLAKDLSSASFADPMLISCLQSARAVSASQSVLFTGTPATLAKVQSLLPAVDTKSTDINPIQLLGENTFLIYKIKQAPYQELLQSLQTFASQLNQSNIADQTLVKSLSSVKWIQETNSLMFTGPQETLRKVEGLVEKFDLSAKAPPPPPKEVPSTFVVYTPKVQRGADLIGVLNEFVQNLSQAGICDAELFETIAHLKFIEKTNSLIISGEPISIQKVEELLTKFDIPGTENNPQIDASNFLIYKLQYHQGVDIQYALKQVATSLSKSSGQLNAALINAIDSLQWVEVTNSLLGTGDPDTLSRIRQLIVNLDVPLRQVFIEVLVVQTTLFNSQNFGLQWGSQFQYLNKTVGAMGNFPTVMNNNINNASNQPPGTLSLSNPISFTTNTSPPVQGNSLLSDTAVPFSTGFDLGVIGDIIFHKGQSFISMGNLLNALQVDNDSTVVMNPKIITQDGRTSSIFVGQNIPFIGSFVSNSASNTVQSSNIEYRNVGVNLVITPTLGTNNIITLDISQDISQQSPNTTNVQGSQVTGIQTSHTTMNTRVHVPDRHFLVLSGMIQDSKTHFRSSIPCLGGLPVIGALFGENDRADSKSNVIIFLRPFIIDSFRDYDQLTADQEDLYKTQAGLQDLKEEFDAGVEMIKDLHND
jgi:type II secretory pathway component GspD/PulD (secretin)